ncbi:O-antigen ligase family protein [Cohnella sp. AR92]|uniref:O-antigen ligase family protein n=1 Tax=Cohnella sp. AR92 TaxID=648716 RepID=UPI000F8F6008|nr:O-antigen ligase family protein [Cohnella sp. AR92]RUS45285.1 hypothetical protein ELR57_20475 [Cohnella sp. AR92]
MGENSKGQVSYYLLVFFIFIVFFSGIINIPLSSSNASTYLIDAMIFLMIFSYIIYSFKSKQVIVNNFNTIYLCLLIIYLAMFLWGNESIFTKILSLRDKILYVFVALFIFRFIKSSFQVDKLLRIVYLLGFIFSVFGIFQFIFRDVLPVWLLTPNNIDLFGFYGTDIIRSTGLLGNTIIYGNIMLLFLSIFINKSISSLKVKDIMFSAIVLISIFTTFSRTAIVGAFIVLLLSMSRIIKDSITRNATKGKILFLFFGFISAIIIALVIIFNSSLNNSIKNSFIYSGLFSQNNASVQNSTEMHKNFITDAIVLLKEHMWFGLGIGSQRHGSLYSMSNVFITDSAFFATLTELGIILFIIYSAFIVLSMYYAFKVRAIKEYRYLANGFLIFSLYEYSFANIVNSSYFGKVFYLLYWMLFGFILTIYHINFKTNKQEYILTSNQSKIHMRDNPIAT